MNLHSTISTKPFQLQVLVPCGQTERPAGGEKRHTYVATEGDTIPGFVAATKKSVTVNILKEASYIATCNPIPQEKLCVKCMHISLSFAEE